MTTTLEILKQLALALNLLSVAFAAPESYPVAPMPINALQGQETASSILAAYPILAKIAMCESGGKQFNDDGSPMWGWDKGVIVKRDVGLMQINLKAHADELKKLNLDVVNSADDNAKFAVMLYERNGTKDWDASRNCWSQ